MIELSARALAEQVNSGALTARAVTETFCARIAAENPRVNALVNFDAGKALAEADAMDARLAKGERLPLAGVPLIVKDNIWAGGFRVTQGSRLFKDFVAPEDAMAVARLRAAGATVIGIGACPEFACKGQTTSPLYGITRHPMDDSLTPGGSSGGNVTGVALGFAPLSLGTDAGGSSRRPPAHTGLVGFKPSSGAVPYGPGFAEPFWGTSCLCPITRTIEDASAMFAVMAGPDPRDPDSVLLAPPEPFDPHKARIAYTPRFGLDVPVDDDVTDAMERAMDALARAGWAIERRDIHWPAGAAESLVMPLQMAGLAALYGERWKAEPELFDPDIGVQIEKGLAFSGADITRALEASQAIRRVVASACADTDLFLGPTTPCVAWSNTRLGPATIGGVPVAPRGHAVFTPLFNHAMVPALSLPCGKGRAGLPVGMQMIARRGRDHYVLAAAAAAEHALKDLT